MEIRGESVPLLSQATTQVAFIGNPGVAADGSGACVQRHSSSNKQLYENDEDQIKYDELINQRPPLALKLLKIIS